MASKQKTTKGSLSADEETNNLRESKTQRIILPESTFQHLFLHIQQLLALSELHEKNNYRKVITTLALQLSRDFQELPSMSFHIFMTEPLVDFENLVCKYLLGVRKGIPLFDYVSEVDTTPATLFVQAPRKDHSQLLKVIRLSIYAAMHLIVETEFMRVMNTPVPSLGRILRRMKQFSKYISHDSSSNISSKVKSRIKGFISSSKSGLVSEKRNNSKSDYFPDLDNSFGELHELQKLEFNGTTFRRHLALMKDLLFSISPDCSYPLPFILIKLARQEEIIFGKMANKKLEDFEHPSCNRPLSLKVSSADRKALQSLLKNNNSVAGIYQHQRINIAYSVYPVDPTKPFGVGCKPCLSSAKFTIDFYQKKDGNEDFTISSFLQALYWNCNGKSPLQHSETSDSLQNNRIKLFADRKPDTLPSCHRKNCNLLYIDHCFVFCHNDTWVSARIEKADKFSIFGLNMDSPSQHVTNIDDIPIFTWGCCRKCGLASKHVNLTEIARHYSFGKFLEHLFYNPNFTFANTSRKEELGPSPLECEHIKKKENVYRFFQFQDVIVRFECRKISLFEIQYPPLQSNSFSYNNNIKQQNSFKELESGDSKHFSNVFPYNQEAWLSMKKGLLQEILQFYDSVDYILESFEKVVGKKASSKKKRLSLIIGKTDENSGESKNFQSRKASPLDHTANDNPRFSEQFEIDKILKQNFPESSTLYTEDNNNSDILSGPLLPIAQRTLSSLYSTIRSEKSNLVQMLKDPSFVFLNNFRSGSFKEKIEYTQCMLENWKDTFLENQEFYHFKDLDLFSKLAIPPYIQPTVRNVFAPPGSSTLIYFNEPSSIIAFALSCKNYISYISSFETEKSKHFPDDLQTDDSSSIMCFNHLKISNSSKKNPSKMEKAQYHPLRNFETPKMLDEDLPSSYESNTFLTEKDIAAPIESSEGAVLKKNPSMQLESKSNDPETPHLEVSVSIEDVSFKVKVYYAKEFEGLRKHCGIHLNFVSSLSHCSSFAPSGGKSSSSFFLTEDKRFIIKQMLNKWNMDELESLLEIAPNYFEYMKGASSSLSVLSKIVGFYSVSWCRKGEKNEQTNEVNLLVMDNLFYNASISQSFDFKGIRGRYKLEREVSGKEDTQRKAMDSEMSTLNQSEKSINNEDQNPTLWDGEWLKGGYSLLYQLHPHSKHVLIEGIKQDLEFLEKCNVMDYSLLVGIDEASSKLYVGIIDYIGHYTIFKKLENGVKETMKGVVKGAGGKGKDVTIVAPDKYKERFLIAVEKYFLSVPDKWYNGDKVTICQDQVNTESSFPASFLTNGAHNVQQLHLPTKDIAAVDPGKGDDGETNARKVAVESLRSSTAGKSFQSQDSFDSFNFETPPAPSQGIIKEMVSSLPFASFLISKEEKKAKDKITTPRSIYQVASVL